MAECIKKSSSETERGQSEKVDKENDHATEERTRIAEFVGKSSLDPGKFPLSGSEDMQMAECIRKSYSGPKEIPPFRDNEIPAGDENKGTQIAGCVGKSNLELRGFPPFGSGGIPARREVKLGSRRIPAVWELGISHQNQGRAGM